MTSDLPASYDAWKTNPDPDPPDCEAAEDAAQERADWDYEEHDHYCAERGIA